jgi:hypothetical protein
MIGRVVASLAVLSAGMIGTQIMYAESPTLEPKEAATLRGLDKVTGFAKDVKIGAGSSILVGSLEVTLRACFQTPPEEAPESAAFLEVRETRASPDEKERTGEDKPLVFSGWMFASTPGLNALEHPVYDVWLISCSASAP